MAVTVAEIVTQGKTLADKLSDGSISDTAGWLVFLNRAQERLYKLITSLDPNAFFAQSDFTLTSTPAGAIRDLSSTLSRFRAMHGLDLNPDTSTRRTVPRKNFRERNRGAVGWWTPTILATDRGYDIRGQNLVITPYESAAGSYRVYYRSGPIIYTAVDTTPIDTIFEPHVEYIEILMARRALGIEESSVGPYSAELAELEALITAAHTRDDGEAAVIADVEGDTFGSWS